MTEAYREKGPLFEGFVKTALRYCMSGATLYRGAQGVEGGAGQADVVAPILHVEAKWRRRTDLRKALKQALEDADPEKLVVVVALDDEVDDDTPAQAMALLPFADLQCLLQSLWSLLGPQQGEAWKKSDWLPPPASLIWAEVGQRKGSKLALRQGVASRGAGGVSDGDGDGDGED